MADSPSNDWLKNIPCLSESLEKRLSRACQTAGFSKALIAEVDEVVKQACIEIAKHQGRDVLICPKCKRLVCPNRQYLYQQFCRQCEEWFEVEG